MTNLHDTDFYSWTQQQADLLRAGNLAALDITNLTEEVEDMGRSEQRELKNRLIVLLMHLLKWQHQPLKRSKSWKTTIKRQRMDITSVLQENPGLKSELLYALEWAYPRAQLDASGETGLDESIFPESCPWTFDQVMDDDFWPE